MTAALSVMLASKWPWNFVNVSGDRGDLQVFSFADFVSSAIIVLQVTETVGLWLASMCLSEEPRGPSPRSDCASSEGSQAGPNNCREGVSVGFQQGGQEEVRAAA